MTNTATFSKERIHILDILRGFALIGLPFANVIGIWIGYLQVTDTSVDIYIQRFIYIFIEGRFFAIFSFLFGIGVWIFYVRAKEKHVNPYGYYYRRMILLLLVGIIHQFLQPGEALFIYALIGCFLPLFFNQPKLFNAIAAVLGIVIGSIFHAKLFLPLPYMMLGVAFAQYGFFSSVIQHRKKWQWIAVVSGILTIISSIFLWIIAPAQGQIAFIDGQILTDGQMESNQQFYEFTKLALLFAPFASVFYVTAISLIGEKLAILSSVLRAYGRTAFTNYLMQTIWLLIALPVLFHGEALTYGQAFLTCSIIIISQMIFSLLWLHFFRYGLFEWLWRCGTYKTWMPFRQ